MDFSAIFTRTHDRRICFKKKKTKDIGIKQTVLNNEHTVVKINTIKSVEKKQPNDSNDK